MDIKTLTRFFMWCSVINGGLLCLWTGMCAFFPNLVYRTQNVFFPMARETFNIVIYSFIGVFKLLFLIFNFVPFIALLIMDEKR